jgi:biopolymer transport protein ExbB/TolQ
MAYDFNLLQVMSKGGWTIGLLMVLSILVVAVLIERLGYYRKAFKPLQEILLVLASSLNRSSLKEALEACDKTGGFLSRIARAGILARMEKSDPFKSMERQAKMELLILERRLPFLATIGSIAPFIGLFGTVLGIIQAFHDLTLANAGGAAVVSQGIAEALFSTATGLFVAIVSVFIYNMFQARLNQAAQEAEILISELGEKLGG